MRYFPLGMQMTKCACGCGQEVKKKFVPGHSLRVYHFSGSVKGKRPDVSERNRINNRLHIGENAYHWKGGRSKERELAQGSEVYKQWRNAVFRRDNYTCRDCGKRGGHNNLEAHHVKEWSLFPELRYEVSNGKTLCKKCHGKTKRLNQWNKR